MAETAPSRACERCQYACTPDALFCARCGVVLGEHTSVAVAGLADPSEPLRRGERRQATVLFADLCDYTALSEGVDPEEVALVMERIKDAASRAIQGHGGLINQFLGDGVVALFGIPVANEDDSRRAIEAALELHGAVHAISQEFEVALGRPLRVHSSVHRGLLVAKSRDIRDGVYGVTGDTINTAARILSHAGPDEIIVSRATFEPVEAFFEAEELPPLTLRGKASPVVAVRVLGTTDTRSGFEVSERRGLSPLVGRERERRELGELVSRLHDGQGALAAVSGEVGAGKSRLFHELRQRVRREGCTEIVGRAEADGRGAAYRPFADALSRWAGLRRGDEPESIASALAARLTGLAADLAGHVPPLLAALSVKSASYPLKSGLAGEGLRTAIGEAVAGWLTALSQQGPVVLLLEDWHWADEASDTVLAEVARRGEGTPLLVVVNHRPMAERLWAPLCTATYSLTPLDVASTAQLVGASLPEGVSSTRVVEAIHRHTGGNPFFVEEVCRSLSETARDVGPVAWENALLEGALPASVHAVLRARIDRLAPDDAELLSVAAVVGGEFSASLLEEVTGLAAPAVAGSLSRMAEVELIHERGSEPGTYRFNHRVTREVAYEALLRTRRRELHERIGVALENATASERRFERCETLAHHFGASGRVERAIQYSILAGDKAGMAFALDEAQRHYGNALGWLDGLPPTPEHRRNRVQISIRWAGACVFRPDVSQLELLARSAAICEELELPAEGARVRYWLGWLAYALGDQEQAIGHSEAGMALAERAGAPRLVAQLGASLGQSWAAATDYDRARAHFDRAFEVAGEATAAESARTATASGGWLAYVYGYLALMAGDVGEFDQAHAHLEDALGRVRAAGLGALEGSIVTQLAIVKAYQGSFQECLDAALQMRAIADRSALPYVLGMSRTAEGYARFHLSEGATGLDALRQAATFLGTRGLALTLSWNHALLAECLALAGEAVEAEFHARAALRRGQVRDCMGELPALRALGLAAAVRRPEHPEEADGLLEQARARAREKKNPREEALTVFRLGEVWMRAGDHERAAIHLHAAEGGFEHMKMPWYAERARRARER